MPDLYRFVGPLLRRLEPEAAHRLTLWALGAGLASAPGEPDDPILATQVWDLAFANPIGLAAGFDKNAAVIGPMLGLGFGFVEAGSLTPRPQAGNPRPRVFRLPEDRAVINRLGFNNAGQAAAQARLAGTGDRRGPLGINLGKNRDAEDAAADYALGARRLAPFAGYLVVNVSSPNTPGLRLLQGREELERILQAVRDAVAEAIPQGRRPPLLVKVAPDIAEADLEDIAALAGAGRCDGLIATNTTIARPADLRGRARREAGGLSGRPLLAPSTEILAALYRLTGGQVPLIGVGGVDSGAAAYAKIRAGASLVQLYTALIYEGPGLVRRIKRELAALLRRDGFASVSDAVGADLR